MNTLTPAEEYAAAVAQAEAAQAALEAARASVADLRAVPVADLLADPSRAAEVADARTLAESLERVALDVLEDARAELTTAARAFSRDTAETYSEHVGNAQVRLDEWRAREAELLAELREHAGTDYQRAPGSAGSMVGTNWADAVWTPDPGPREQELVDAVWRLEAQHADFLALAGDTPRLTCPPRWRSELLNELAAILAA